MIFSSIVFSILSLLEPTSLRELLKVGTEGADWSSLEHRHHYQDEGLRLLVERVINDLEKDPEGFDQSLTQLTSLERSQLAFDSIDSRTDLIDLLSIELKLRLTDKIAKSWPEIRIDSSELWSVAKFRLKSALEPEVKRSTGVMIFRFPGLQTTRALLFCGHSKGASLSGQSTSQTLGGIKIFETEVSKTMTLSCGERKYTLEVSSTDSHLKTSKPGWRLPEFQNAREIRYSAMIGLSATMSPMMVNLTRRYIEWVHGFKLRSIQEGSLKDFLKESIPNADILFFAVNLPDGNNFELSNQAEWGQKLVFERKTNSGRIQFDILLPPTRSDSTRERVRQERGVRFNFEEMTKLLKGRSLPLQLIDLTCFSEKHLKDWTESALAAAAKNPWVIASARGQQAEGVLDLIPQVDLMLSLMKTMADQESSESQELLDRGSPLFRWIPRTVSFLPMATFDQSFQPYLLARQRKILWLKESASNGRIFRFNPLL